MAKKQRLIITPIDSNGRVGQPILITKQGRLDKAFEFFGIVLLWIIYTGLLGIMLWIFQEAY